MPKRKMIIYLLTPLRLFELISSADSVITLAEIDAAANATAEVDIGLVEIVFKLLLALSSNGRGTPLGVSARPTRSCCPAKSKQFMLETAAIAASSDSKSM